MVKIYADENYAEAIDIQFLQEGAFGVLGRKLSWRATSEGLQVLKPGQNNICINDLDGSSDLYYDLNTVTSDAIVSPG